MQSKIESAFSGFGKLSLVLGIIIACFTIYNTINPDRPDLKATCFTSEIPSTPKEIELKQKNKELFEENTRLKNKKNNSNLLEYLGFPDLEYNTIYYCKCSITNFGTREATSVQLLVPLDVIAASINKKSIAVSPDQKNTITIGPIRSDVSIEIEIWQKGYLTYYDDEKYKINSSETKGTIDIGKVYYGFPSSIAKFVEALVKNPEILLILIFVFIINVVYPLFKQVNYFQRENSNIVQTGMDGNIHNFFVQKKPNSRTLNNSFSELDDIDDTG